jgi:hypothetical protein
MTFRPDPKPVKNEKKPKRPIPKVSVKKKQGLKEYKKVRADYLAKHPTCQVEGCRRFASEIHHRRGRVGALLCDVAHFLSVCRTCHQRIEINPTWAKENGYSESRLAIDDREIYH